MSEKEYIVLYTHQKTKKAKTWQDGFLKLSTGTKAILYDEKKIKLDAIHIRPEAIILGEQLESDRYLILIEEEKASSSSSAERSCQSVSRSTVGRSVTLSGNQKQMTPATRTGIKRRITGFVPPRMVKPRIETDLTNSSADIPNHGNLANLNVNNFHRENAATVNVLNLYSESENKDDSLSIQSQTLAGRFYKRNIIYPKSTDNHEPCNKHDSSTSQEESSNPLSDFINKLRNSSPVLSDSGSQNSSQLQRTQPSSPWSSYGASKLRKSNNTENTNMPFLMNTTVSQNETCNESTLENKICYPNTGTIPYQGHMSTSEGTVNKSFSVRSPVSVPKPVFGNKRSALQIMALLKNNGAGTQKTLHSITASQSHEAVTTGNLPLNSVDISPNDKQHTTRKLASLSVSRTDDNLSKSVKDNKKSVEDQERSGTTITTDHSKALIQKELEKLVCSNASNSVPENFEEVESDLQNSQDPSIIESSKDAFTGEGQKSSSFPCNNNYFISSPSKEISSIGNESSDGSVSKWINFPDIQNSKDHELSSRRNESDNTDNFLEAENHVEDCDTAGGATFEISFSPLSCVMDSEEDADDRDNIIAGAECVNKGNIQREASHPDDKEVSLSTCLSSYVKDGGNSLSQGNKESKDQDDRESNGEGDSESKGHGDSESKGQGDSEHIVQGDRESKGQDDRESKGQGDSESKGQGDSESKGQGDSEHIVQGDRESKGQDDRKSKGQGDSESKGVGDSEHIVQGDRESKVQAERECKDQSKEESQDRDYRDISSFCGEIIVAGQGEPLDQGDRESVGQGNGKVKRQSGGEIIIQDCNNTSGNWGGKTTAQEIIHQNMKLDVVQGEGQNVGQGYGRTIDQVDENADMQSNTSQVITSGSTVNFPIHKRKTLDNSIGCDDGADVSTDSLIINNINNINNVTTRLDVQREILLRHPQHNGKQIEQSTSLDILTSKELQHSDVNLESSNSENSHKFLKSSSGVKELKERNFSPKINSPNQCCQDFDKDSSTESGTLKGDNVLEIYDSVSGLVGIKEDRNIGDEWTDDEDVGLACEMKQIEDKGSKNVLKKKESDTSTATDLMPCSVSHGSAVTVTAIQDTLTYANTSDNKCLNDLEFSQDSMKMVSLSSNQEIDDVLLELPSIKKTQNDTVVSGSEMSVSSCRTLPANFMTCYTEIPVEDGELNHTEKETIPSIPSSFNSEGLPSEQYGDHLQQKDLQRHVVVTRQDFATFDKDVNSRCKNAGKVSSVTSSQGSNSSVIFGNQHSFVHEIQEQCSSPITEFRNTLQLFSNNATVKKHKLTAIEEFKSAMSKIENAEELSTLNKEGTSDRFMFEKCRFGGGDENRDHVTANQEKCRVLQSGEGSVTEPGDFGCTRHSTSNLGYLEHLPHPSQLLKSNYPVPSHTPLEKTNMMDSANFKLQQYKMKGSVSGGKATRTSELNSGRVSRFEMYEGRAYNENEGGTTKSGRLEGRTSDLTGVTRSVINCSSLENLPGMLQREISPNVFIQSAQHTRSPSQTLEGMASPSYSEEHSMFIDWNQGKPKFVKKSQVPKSPYHFVPRISRPEQDKVETDQHVPDVDSRFCSPVNMTENASHSLLNQPFPADESPEFGSMFKLRKSHGGQIKSHGLSSINSLNRTTDDEVGFCSKKETYSGTPDYPHSPKYEHLFRNQRRPAATPMNTSERIKEIPRERKALKCKPFDDQFTHTKYGNCYFSPSEQTAPIDIEVNNISNDRAGFISCSPQFLYIDNRNDKKLLSMDDNDQKKDCSTKNTPFNNKAQIVGTLSTSHEVKSVNPCRASNRITDQVSLQTTEGQNKLQLSNSSIGSSDLELSFLGECHESLQHEDRTDHREGFQSFCDAQHRKNDIADAKDSGSRQSCSYNVCVTSLPTQSSVSDQDPNSLFCEGKDTPELKRVESDKSDLSKWGKYLLAGNNLSSDDEDFITISDNSIEDSYQTGRNDRSLTDRNNTLSKQVLSDKINDSNMKSSSLLYRGREARQATVALKRPELPTQQDLAERQPLQQGWLNTSSVMRTCSSSSVEEPTINYEVEEDEEQFTSKVLPDLYSESYTSSAASNRPRYKSSKQPIVSSTPSADNRKDIEQYDVDVPTSQNIVLNTPVGMCASQHKLGLKRKFQTPVSGALYTTHVLKTSQRNLGGELQFASKEEVENSPTPSRDIQIPTTYPSAAVYRQVFTSAIKEYLNIVLFDLAKQYHHALSKVDISSIVTEQSMAPAMKRQKTHSSANQNPQCQCGVPSKMVQVKKSGRNQGRFFYACNAARNQQCKFFQWADQDSGGHSKGDQNKSAQLSKLKLCDVATVNTYMRGHRVMYYCGCEFLKKSQEDITSHFKKNVPEWVKKKYQTNTNLDKKKLFIHLSKRDDSSQFAKDDLWIISRGVDFHPFNTFLARSTYFGPNSSNDVEIEPITSFSPSSWPSHIPQDGTAKLKPQVLPMCRSLFLNPFLSDFVFSFVVSCHCIQAGNVSSELSYLANLQENLTLTSLPILPFLLNRSGESDKPVQSSGFRAPVKSNSELPTNIHAPVTYIKDLADEMKQLYHLNTDQSAALTRLCDIFCREEQADPVLLVHGVFGAGKSFLLSIMVIFLVKLFELNDSYTPGVPYPWKILISSTTNVAVDRILNGLLGIGFEEFVRVGSVRKIAKSILPYSFHAAGTDSQELKDLQSMLRNGDLSPSEKHNVKQSIEKHRLGDNKKKLGQVRVVGVTCASCAANSLNKMMFPVVVLDECSQMMEPASLLPLAKFSCQKLVLVGDPKQLDPTIQGVEASHGSGLEQTLFSRLMQMGHEPTMLRMQYRCHPAISKLSNTLFYGGHLVDGVTDNDRLPLSEDFSTLCFYDASDGQEQSDSGHSYYNEKEANFVVFLIESLISRGIEPADIGVITLYKSQMFRINTILNTTKCHKEMKSLRISTVDAFQGGEHNVVILSCVRTNSVGFIDNAKRTNVALTRARHHLFIVGNKKNLSRDKMWSNILQQCAINPDGVQNCQAARERLQDKSSNVPCDSSTVDKTKVRRKPNDTETQDSTWSSPPMSLSGSLEDLSFKGNEQELVIGNKKSDCAIKSAGRKLVRQINADLLDSAESEEDLPDYNL